MAISQFLRYGICMSAVALAACGKPANTSAPSASAASTPAAAASSAASSDLLQRINNKGTITVGTEGTYAPFSFHDKAGQLSGYDIDVTNEVAKRLSVKVEYKETQWDAMFAGLNSQRFDVIANQVGVNPERQAKYAFSSPYSYSGAAVLVRDNNTTVLKWEDLKDQRAAQSLTSNFGKIATERGAKIVGVEGLAQSAELLRQGRADLTVNDELAILDYIKANQGAGLKIAITDPKKVGSAFTVLPANADATKKFDEALQQMQADGTLAKIGEKWFGKDISKP